MWASVAAAHELSSCGTQAELFCRVWNLPRPGIEPVSPELASGFFTTEPPGKSACAVFYKSRHQGLEGFPDDSVGKESAGDPGLICGLGRSTGEGIGYLLHYSWASLVAQLVKNPPAMWETSFRFLGWEDPLEKGKATHSSILAWRIPWTV